jgi:ABC-type multidrug transport system fused ATPase/permease subunit
MMAFLRELAPYNRPIWSNILGFFSNLIHGCTMPTLGMLIVQCIFSMSNPDFDKMVLDVNYWVVWIVVCGSIELFTCFVGKSMFCIIGENITLHIRKDLYVSILQKHMGWHDNREHSAGNLTSILSS